MREVITIINRKGGVAKTTTAKNIAAGLSEQGYKVLLIDLDGQASLTIDFEAPTNAGNSLELLTQTREATELITHTQQGDIIPASAALAGADSIITETGKEYRLKEALEPLYKKYDYIIIDTPPALGTLTVNALTACDSVIIPTTADSYSLVGVGSLAETIERIKRYTNPSLKVKGILITRFNGRTIIGRDMAQNAEEIARLLQTKVFKTKIRDCVAVKEAQAMHRDLFTYSPKCNATADYRNLTKEILEEVQG